jgi:hypothetical protein
VAGEKCCAVSSDFLTSPGRRVIPIILAPICSTSDVRPTIDNLAYVVSMIYKYMKFATGLTGLGANHAGMRVANSSRDDLSAEWMSTSICVDMIVDVGAGTPRYWVPCDHSWTAKSVGPPGL